jgi:hypothetical protein
VGPTSEPDPETKTRAHTLKFQQICLKFVGNVLEWQSAILCNLVQLDPHLWYIWKMNFMWYRTGLRCRFGLVCGLLHHLVSLVWINKRNGLDGVVSIIFSFMYGLIWFWGGSQTIGSLNDKLSRYSLITVILCQGGLVSMFEFWTMRTMIGYVLW